MATVIAQSELIKRAITWISEALAEKKDFAKVIEEASMRFNLSPKDVEFLTKFFKDNPEPRP